jgi:hypothetical protein
MKFFTPELLERVASFDDEVADAADGEWERAITRYQRRWQKIQAAFPREVRRFQDEGVCLHDAEVLTMGTREGVFFIVLRRDAPSQDLVLLNFTLEGEAQISPGTLPADNASGPVTWMYEEFDLDRSRKCRIEVLLSNGWSVRLVFRHFHYVLAQQVIPGAGPTPTSKGVAVSRSA